MCHFRTARRRSLSDIRAWGRRGTRRGRRTRRPPSPRPRRRTPRPRRQSADPDSDTPVRSRRTFRRRHRCRYTGRVRAAGVRSHSCRSRESLPTGTSRTFPGSSCRSRRRRRSGQRCSAHPARRTARSPPWPDTCSLRRWPLTGNPPWRDTPGGTMRSSRCSEALRTPPAAAPILRERASRARHVRGRCRDHRDRHTPRRSRRHPRNAPRHRRRRVHKPCCYRDEEHIVRPGTSCARRSPHPHRRTSGTQFLRTCRGHTKRLRPRSSGQPRRRPPQGAAGPRHTPASRRPLSPSDTCRPRRAPRRSDHHRWNPPLHRPSARPGEVR